MPSRMITGCSEMLNGLFADAVSPTVITAVINTASAIKPFTSVLRRSTDDPKANFVPKAAHRGPRIC